MSISKLPSQSHSRGASGFAGAVFLNSRPIAVNRNVLHIAGGAASGIFLSQLIYWTQRGVDVIQQDGWIRKTADQWLLETGMSWKVQNRARKQLLEQGLIEERLRGLPAQKEYKINLPELAKRTAELMHITLARQVDLATFRTEELLIKQLLGRATAYHRKLAELCPHINDALFLSRLLQEAGGNPDKWICHSRNEWLAELVLSRPEWETSRKHLKDLGFIFERGSNYPRRIDFQVQTAPLASALVRLQEAKTAEKGKSLANRTDRAKQADGNPTIEENHPLGGIGRNCEAGFTPSESPNPAYPDPAFKDHPIQPTSFAQSSLYKKENGLQGELQQPLQQAQAVAPAEVVVVGSELIWPNWIDAVEKQIIKTYLGRISTEAAQDVLDEMEWLKSSTGVHNAAGLARKLTALASTNQFVAEGAHKVQADRIQAKRVAAAVAAASSQTGNPALSAPKEKYAGVPPHIKQRLAEGAAALKSRMGR